MCTPMSEDRAALSDAARRMQDGARWRRGGGAATGRERLRTVQVDTVDTESTSRPAA